jgi:energy-coupling factor transporter ATP-binding protein EcfA2
MIIELKESKNIKCLISKNMKIKKERGENILFSGCTGTGKTEATLTLYNLLLKNKTIEKTIFINIHAEFSLYLKWLSILNNYSKINKKDFNLFNLAEDSELESFNKIDFSSETVQKSLDKNIMFLIPVLEKNQLELSKRVNPQLYNYLNNLPINNGKEIAIIISDDYRLEKDQQVKFDKLIISLNDRGYFFIKATQNSYRYKGNSSYLLSDMYQHIFSMKVFEEDEKLREHYKVNGLKKKLINLNTGEYYYSKNLKYIHKRPKNFPYLKMKLMDSFPEYSSISSFVLMNKIENF